VTDPRAKEMLAAYKKEGLTLAAVGERYGLSAERVRQLISPLRGYVANRQPRGQAARTAEIVAAHKRIVARETTSAEEAERLGYASAASFRFALYSLGLRIGRPPLGHGTYASYQRGCRCDECTESMREHYRQRYEEGPKRHGTASGYSNYRCRCPKCKAAWRAHRRALRVRRRSAKEPVV